MSTAVFKSSKAQGWTIDYVVSFLIFIIAGIIAVKLLTNTFVSDEFNNVARESIRISDHLLSRGVPSNWGASGVVIIGLTSSKNRISQIKAENFLGLNYSTTKNRFGVKNDYAFYFEDKNGTIISVLDQCAMGSSELSQSKNTFSELRPSAYYYRDESFMTGWMAALGADLYDGNNNVDVDNFYGSLGNYNFVLMENPEIDSGGLISLSGKVAALESFVNSGGSLFLSENISTNLTGIGIKTTTDFHADVLNVADPYFQLAPGARVTDNDVADKSFTIEGANASGFTVLAQYENTGEPWLARWNYGLGKVYYFATANSQYTGGLGTDFQNKVGEAAEAIVNVTRANCTGLGLENIESESIVRLERLAIYNSEIVKMVVLAWS